MKKMICICGIALLMMGTKVQAAVGDIVSKIYTTDILTYVDDAPIKGYAINGKTMICLEDLRDYGFSVVYDDSVRMLIVNKTGKKAEDFNPYFERGKVGDTAGNVYETDIIAVVNGEKSNAFAIDGRMVVAVEDLGVAKYNNRMSFQYDDSQRKLWLYTTKKLDYEQGYNYWKELYMNNEPFANIVLADDYAVFWFCTLNPKQHYGTLVAQISYKNGQSDVSLNAILSRYGVDTRKISLDGASFEIDNESGKLIFHNSDYGEIYGIDPYTLQMCKIK